MSRAKRFYLFLSLTIAGLGLGLVTLELWGFIHLSNMKSQALEQRYRTSKFNEREKALTNLKTTYEKIKLDADAINSTLPDEKESSKLISNLDQLTKEVGLKITLIQSANTKKKGASSSDPSLLQTVQGSNSLELPLNIEISGSYQNALLFIGKLEKYQRLVNIDSLEITKNTTDPLDDNVTLKMRITAYIMK